VDFDDQHDHWRFDGPLLPLEFSRISKSRSGALTLVIDRKNGKQCCVAYAVSRRRNPDDAICDLRSREGTTVSNIGYCLTDGSQKQGRDTQVLQAISEWALSKKLDAVTWTDLQNNFKRESKSHQAFSVPNAISYLRALDTEGKAKAIEYVRRAPNFVGTPLREALMHEPWFFV